MSDRKQALDALYGTIVSDSGVRWGERATVEQRADAEALLDPSAERFSFHLRPRGGSKTEDLAVVLAVVLAYQAGPSDRMFAFAADRSQAGILADFIGQIARRTPALRSLQIGRSEITAPSGASLRVMSADSASAFGLLPSWIAVDELCWWPTGHERLWTAITSAMGKRPDSRLSVISAPSSPTHWSHKIFEHALKSSQWRVSHWSPGSPLPWVDEAYLEEQRISLTDADFRRLHLASWAEGDGGLAMLDDVLAACHLQGPQPYRAGRRYIVSCDAGIVRDRTAAVVAHLEPSPAGERPRIEVDRLAVWAGSKDSPVELQEVQQWLHQAWQSYGRPTLVLDPWQMISTAQALRREGVKVEEFVFSSGASKLAGALYSVLRERRIDLPNDKSLIEELQSVRLVETSPGRVKLDNPAGTHDDRATAIGLAALHLLERPPRQKASSWNRKTAGRDDVSETTRVGDLLLHGPEYQDRVPGKPAKRTLPPGAPPPRRRIS